MDDPNSEYEETINKLSEQIIELFTKIHFYQALIGEKDHQISQLTKENRQLKAQIQNLTHELTPPSYPSQQSYTPPPISKPQALSSPPISESPSYVPPAPQQEPIPAINSSEEPRINKRVCPNCGAMGFAIREIDDKSRIISYIPRRIYAKKKACTKCRYEW
jgi:hypothetical protein